MNGLTAVSLFAGIGGFDIALERSGADVVAAVEINDDCRGVLARHFPHTTLFGDVTEVTGDQLRAAGFVPGRGIIAGGWPCQGNSVAGHRKGMADPRSGLWRQVVRLLAETRPRWFLGENVPGLLSINDGQDFGTVIRDLDELGYGVAWRVLDAQWFGLAQRRKRLFVAACLGDGSAPVEVLLEPEGGEGHIAAGRQARAGVAGGPSARAGNARATVATLQGGGKRGHRIDAEGAAGGHLIAHAITAREAKGADSDATSGFIVAASLTAGSAAGEGVNAPGRRREDDVNLVAHALTSEGADASEDGTGRGTPLVTVTSLAVAGDFSSGENIAQTVRGAHGQPGNVATAAAVRRLTPMECERLQGFPDGWTEGQSDSARYRQLGNAVAVPVIEWITGRIAAVEAQADPMTTEGAA